MLNIISKHQSHTFKALLIEQNSSISPGDCNLHQKEDLDQIKSVMYGRILSNPLTHFLDKYGSSYSPLQSGKWAHLYKGKHAPKNIEPAGYKRAHFIQKYAEGRF